MCSENVGLKPIIIQTVQTQLTDNILKVFFYLQKEVQIPQTSVNFRDKFGITGDNRKQILLGLARNWNAGNKASNQSEAIKTSRPESKNFVQLRGNISDLNPTFYTAFPGDGSEIKSFKSISDCLTTAWIKMKP